MEQHQRMAVVDIDTGAVYDRVRLSQPGAGVRAKSIKLMQGLIAWARSTWGTTMDLVRVGERRYEKKPCVARTQLWTFGTRYTSEEQIDHLAGQLGQVLTAYGARWCMALERGAQGERWHVHVLAAGLENPVVEWHRLHEVWSEMTGDVKDGKPTAHVTFVRVWGDGAAFYVAKYLGRRLGAEQSTLKRFRSTRLLRELVAEHIPTRTAANMWYETDQEKKAA